MQMMVIAELYFASVREYSQSHEAASQCLVEGVIPLQNKSLYL